MNKTSSFNEIQRTFCKTSKNRILINSSLNEKAKIKQAEIL